MNIHMARFQAEPLEGNYYHGRAFGAWILYYAFAEDSADFARKIEAFATHEKWELRRDSVEGGVTSRERFSSKPLTLQALDEQGDFAEIHWSPFSSD